MRANNLKTLSDEELAKEVVLENRDAMSELYARYHSLVFSKCLSFSKNKEDANDLSQDVMMRVLQKINSFKGESKFSTWLYAVTFNFCTDHVRKAKRNYSESIDTNSEFAYAFMIEDDEVEENLINAEVAEKVLAAIPKEEHQLLLMKYQANKSIGELQRTYSISASAVKMRLLRARSKANEIYNYLTLHPAA